jgi:hypothetical protein
MDPPGEDHQRAMGDLHPAADRMDEVVDHMDLSEEQGATAPAESTGFFHTDMLIPLLLFVAFVYFIYQVSSLLPDLIHSFAPSQFISF